MIQLYKFLGILFIPLIKLHLKNRVKKGKESKERIQERFGISNITLKNNRKLLWIHAASIGEFKSSHFIIENFYKKYTILITTTTLSAANFAKKKYGEKIIHQYAPIDISFWVSKFLDKWKPSLIIWIESDLWPVTMHTIRKKKINAILVNLRISPKSFKKWKKVPFFYNQLLRTFLHIYAQSKIDQQRIKLLSKKDIKYIGNLKLAISNDDFLSVNKFQFKKNKKNITLMIASTHDDEEKQIIPILKILLKNNSNLQIIIAPRHPERADDVLSLCNSYELSCELESQIREHNNQIIIINSFGILSKYFNLSDIVFLGGSLVSAGGHNPIEPAKHGCAILTGPEIFNWENIFEDIINANGCNKINNTNELLNVLKNLVNDKNKIEQMKENAYKFSQKNFFDNKALEKVINIYMDLNIC